MFKALSRQFKTAPGRLRSQVAFRILTKEVKAKKVRVIESDDRGGREA
jgi:hypothetical protein